MVTLSTSVVAAGTRAGKFVRRYASFAEMMAADDTLAQGEELTWDIHRYIVAASGASDHHLTRNDGTKLYVQRAEQGYNALAFGAVGDGETDVSAQLKLAYDVAGIEGNALYIPGQDSYYNVGTTGLVANDLVVNRKVLIRGEGNASHIRGAVTDGAILHRSEIPGGVLANSGGNGIMGMRDLRIENTAVSEAGTSWGILWRGGVGTFEISNCFINAESGIDANAFTLSIDNCRLEAKGINRTGIGIITEGARINACDITGFGEGVRHYGFNVSMSACRFEICGTGVRSGIGRNGSAELVDRSHYDGLTLEANDIGMDIHSFTGTMNGIAIQGSSNAPSGQSTHGVIIRDGRACLSSFRFVGQFSEAAMDVRGGGNTFVNITATNFFGDPDDRPEWSVSDATENIYINCNYEPGKTRGGAVRTLIPTAMTGGIAQINALSQPPQPRNVCCTLVPVTEGATSVAVLFPPDRTSVNSQINTVTAVSGGSLTDGTYYYLATVVTRTGESGQASSGEQSVTTSSPNSTARIAFFNAGASDYIRRIYRRSSDTGLYDGYFDHPAGSATFDDTGQAFSGYKQPAIAGVEPPSAQETDANYGVIVTPSWGTTAWVTNKATSGFTINFGTAAPANATVDWILMR